MCLSLPDLVGRLGITSLLTFCHGERRINVVDDCQLEHCTPHPANGRKLAVRDIQVQRQALPSHILVPSGEQQDVPAAVHHALRYRKLSVASKDQCLCSTHDAPGKPAHFKFL